MTTTLLKAMVKISLVRRRLYTGKNVLARSRGACLVVEYHLESIKRNNVIRLV